MNRENVSVRIIAGFLGARKTTFISKLIRICSNDL